MKYLSIALMLMLATLIAFAAATRPGARASASQAAPWQRLPDPPNGCHYWARQVEDGNGATRAVIVVSSGSGCPVAVGLR